MRSSLPMTLLALVPTLVASTATPECINSRAKELAGRSLCGDKKTLRKCYEKASGELLESAIQECLTNAGCTEAAAAVEASYLITFCEGEEGELKRRDVRVARDSVASGTDSTTSSETTTTTTDSTSSTTTSVASTASTGTVAKRTDTTTAASTTTAATTAAATTSNSCSTASKTKVSACDSDNEYNCSMTETETMVCIATMYCDTDSEGNNLCMVRQDGLTTSGAVVTIFLAVCLTGIIATITFLCCKDRKEAKRNRARAEAAAIAKANAPTKPATRSVSQRTTGDAQPNPFSG
ncbi:hypothetical protein PFICI_00315 [Pestalotiopsis fici W106-1]|uniref:Extracellular membrane protein CFEM domain-containing protein n=1 Tax=Pestalotiopsis fici (strain W106-1 / CGMCC3.15140) TaxID=1229662 RepID=W3XLX8_PESFW|nr:uncharacterized protein PFICI_00315 [Pestalotiopsis fici W106-1]ETS86487.1 hypothetical protein PFICI_00315 [Pestalotiopsis fici W106-1]